tara:strand:- start:716 stop:1177 length:462 start_codon:yes stop_codon:yes gene_type:complete
MSRLSIFFIASSLLISSCSSDNKIKLNKLKPINSATPAQTQNQPVELTEQIYFDFDSSSLNSMAYKIIKQNAQLLKQTNDNILLAGNCDERGTKEYNLALGEQRAIAVREALIRNGVNRSQITYISYGEEKPVAYGSNEQAYKQNRRVDFVIK